MKNHLVYYNWPLRPHNFAVVLDQMDEALSAGDKVFVLYCDGGMHPCRTNRLCNDSICAACQFSLKQTMKSYGDRVELIPISAVRGDAKTIEVGDLDDILNLTYRGVEVGYGAMSSYISWTRNLEPLSGGEEEEYVARMVQNQVALTDIAYDLLVEKEIDDVIVFNSRFADVRPIVEVAKRLGVRRTVLEMVGDGDGRFKKVTFADSDPHSVEGATDRVRRVWRERGEGDPRRTDTSEEFYRRRRAGELVADVKIHADRQKQGRMPCGWDDAAKNIVVFVSSEDEFAAIGSDFRRYSLFRSQEEGIRFIAEHTQGEDVDLYVRIHPNLRGIEYGYHRRLVLLQDEYDHVTVVPALSEVSTYALVDSADLVVVFGSSVGAEAAYVGKPVILLSGCFYYNLDITHNPTSKQELAEMLDAPPAPKSREGALKYGYFLMNLANSADDIASELHYATVPVLNSTLILHDKMRLLGSKALYRLGVWSMEALARKRGTNTYDKIPDRGL